MKLRIFLLTSFLFFAIFHPLGSIKFDPQSTCQVISMQLGLDGNLLSSELS